MKTESCDYDLDDDGVLDADEILGCMMIQLIILI